jgi:lipoprotein-anchoring transpeptidase ErfK/SrfK
MRTVAALMLALVGLLLGVGLAPRSALAASYDLGPQQVYFPQTGHYLSAGFLDYWHLNGDVTVFGYPISEEFQQNGLTVQYFERAVFEYHADAPPGSQVQLRRLGQQALSAAQLDFTTGQLRQIYLDFRLGTQFKPSDPFTPLPDGPRDASHRFFAETGHTLANTFKNYWEMWGGLTIFGYPLTEEYTDPVTGHIVQYFERAVFAYDPESPGNPVQFRLLGADAARRDGVDTAPLRQSESAPAYDAALWKRDPSVKPTDITVPPPGAPFGETKWIEVDLTQQYLRAWEGRTVVFGTYISTGLDPNPTPTGYFSVFEKLPKDEMTNGPNPPPGEARYDLKDVPNVMYFLAGGYAIHGAYWHWNFGQRVSHGCVNLPLDAAAWMYAWTPMGTTVWIHD